MRMNDARISDQAEFVWMLYSFKPLAVSLLQLSQVMGREEQNRFYSREPIKSMEACWKGIYPRPVPGEGRSLALCVCPRPFMSYALMRSCVSAVLLYECSVFIHLLDIYLYL